MIKEDKFESYEPDAAKWTWDNLYNKTYRTLNYWDNLDIEKRVNSRYMHASYAYKNSDKIQIGGDVIFNFKGGHGKIFQDLLGNQYNENAYTLMHYSVLNFSFMPVTGGLNLNKANGKYCDRLDRLIFYLDQFIQTGKLDMTNPLVKIRGNNKKTVSKLAEYITSFNSIDEYCRAYYLLDSKKTDLVYKLRDLGKEYVNKGATAENCKQYLNLASKVWKYRNKIFKEDYGLDVCCLDNGINIDELDL